MHYVEMGRRRAVWGGAAGGRKGESPQAPDRVGVMLWLLPELRSAGKNASKAWDLCSRLCICFAMRLPFALFTCFMRFQLCAYCAVMR